MGLDFPLLRHCAALHSGFCFFAHFATAGMERSEMTALRPSNIGVLRYHVPSPSERG